MYHTGEPAIASAIPQPITTAGEAVRRRKYRKKTRNALVRPIPVATSTASPTTALWGLSIASPYPSIMSPNKSQPPNCSDQNTVSCETCLPDPNTSEPGLLAESNIVAKHNPEA
jgi:hypothetical protein